MAMMLGWKKFPAKMGAGLVIPFRGLDGEPNGYKRLRPDNPRPKRDSKGVIKYESPKGGGNRVFIPPGTVAVLKDADRELLLTEGEFKAAKADQDGFPCLGLVGVFGFARTGTADLPIELEYVDWNNRRVFIVFDSDLAENENVQRAESRLAATLKARGAIVRVVRLSAGPNGEKTGLDDFLVREDRVALRKLLDSAEEPTVEEDDSKEPANALDPMDTARDFITCYATKGEERTLQNWRSEFWAWHQNAYRRMPDGDISARVTKYIDTIATHVTTKVVANVLNGVRAEAIVGAHLEQPCWLGPDPGPPSCVAMENGILDVTKAIAGADDCLLPHSPRWFSPICLPYPFNPKADCPTWKRVIERNMGGDEERIGLLQEWAGLLLLPDTSYQKFMLLVGEGSNGKSVYCALLIALLGQRNVSAVPLESFGMRFQLNATLGKLANIAAEVGDLDKVAEGFLKSFTSGDTLQFERKHKDPFEALPTARLVLATNNPPRFSDKSGGLWRRMLYVPWDVVIPPEERIVGMDKPGWWTATGEMPGVLNWALEGLRRLRSQGRFSKSSVCEQALSEYRMESNPARQFLIDRYREHPNGELVTTEVYGKYVNWCESSGYRPLASNTFGKEILRAFPGAKKAKVRNFENHRCEGYIGVAEGAAV